MYQKIATFVKSHTFFRIIVGLLIVEATWIALSSHYPMAFDEDFHFGIIKLYAHHLSPWWNHQPAGANTFGAVYRDPSYLYHWLMSFPYRFIALFAHTTIEQVIALRLMNVAIFASGLIVLRRLLLKATNSTALVNLALLFLVLTPVIPSLAGQINYDNLLFLLVPASLLLTVQFLEELRSNKRINLRLLGSLTILCLLASLVKYAFLPVFFVIGIFMLVLFIRTYKQPSRHFKKEVASAYKQLSRVIRLSLVVGILLSGGLFFERYGINTIKYHTPLPECNQVLNTQACLSYGPWARNYNIELAKQGPTNLNAVRFSQHWTFVLYRSLFYVLNGPDSSYTVGQPLLLPSVVAVVVLIGGMYCLIRYRRQVFGGNVARILLAALIIVYASALWLQNYRDYVHLGQPVALQGRYLIPILAPLYLLLGVGIARGLRGHRQTQIIMASVAVVLFLQGGGIITFLVRSDDSWYIENSVSARVNNRVQPVVKRAVIGK